MVWDMNFEGKATRLSILAESLILLYMLIYMLILLYVLVHISNPFNKED